MGLVDKAKAIPPPGPLLTHWVKNLTKRQHDEVNELLHAFADGKLPPHVTAADLADRVLAAEGIVVVTIHLVLLEMPTASL